MDDPWGSPWASSETPSKNDLTTPSPPKDFLSPPPRAFFGSTSNLQNQSPWADNGSGFGDWASADTADITTNALDWGVWAEPSPQISRQSSPRPDESKQSGSLAIPSSTATSPGLRPLPRSRSSSVFRHHSPDPWAIEAQLRDKDAPTTSWSGLEAAGADAQRETVEASVATSQTHDEKGAETLDSITDNVQSKEGGDNTEDALTVQEPPRESYGSRPKSAPKVEIHDSPSRPSSTFSIDSSNGLDRQDSPITSIDEEPKLRLQTPSRKPSGKVQELVGMYDDIAKAATEEPSPSTRLKPSRSRSRGRSPSQNRGTDIEGDIDFGDFEDAKSEYDRLTPDIHASVSSGSPSTPKAQVGDTSVQDETRGPTSPENVAPEIVTVSVQQIIEKYGPIRFDVDYTPLDNLFPDLAQHVDDNVGDVGEVSDRIIEDNFSTISERKTWYRISRFGSMRKHDSGDEDNYHRVEWATSHLHGDTIKIVRRWMEEDSITGRATLGAGKRTGVFNWDSSASPVDLGKVFARKSAITHSRNISMPLPNQSSKEPMKSAGPDSEARRSLNNPARPSSTTLGSRPSALPSFGWTADTNKSHPISHPVSSSGKMGPPIVSKNGHTPETIKTESSTRVAIQKPAQLKQTKDSVEDEDDEWGEMVSSPQLKAHPMPTLATQVAEKRHSAGSAKVGIGKDTPNSGPKNSTTVQSSDLSFKLSVTIPQSSQTPKQVPIQAEESSEKAPRVDPWPLADFSIFENLSARTPKSPKQNPWPLADFSIFESPASKSTSTSTNSRKAKPEPVPKHHENRHVQVKADRVSQSGPPLKAVLGPIQKSDTEQDQEQIVRRIVQNLPDLSYMLR
ncbi:uncharacterized protein F4822DRAFT_163091 [Hypoxylon trugodes]|uniref:uncharacterized protein n=1 Tax=Hypoxylon trugodes TaxID=326681 RepID=UPI00219B4087|nr:uncharacterized protein F4822DRAFT_163091 [Hypoxylon trugodes]KAI1390777.1 hypothetical protein F4822DRAFT_163091 [Hypoxylon trugodes]